jgi:hypothetical protein
METMPLFTHEEEAAVLRATLLNYSCTAIVFSGETGGRSRGLYVRDLCRVFSRIKLGRAGGQVKSNAGAGSLFLFDLMSPMRFDGTLIAT